MLSVYHILNDRVDKGATSTGWSLFFRQFPELHVVKHGNNNDPMNDIVAAVPQCYASIQL